MRLWGIFVFELTYQVRRVWPWLVFLILLVVNFLSTRDGSLAEALLDDFYINSPFAMAKTMVFGSLLWMLLAPAVAGDAAARDIATRMHPLTYTTPIRTAEYLGGKFLAALVLNLLLMTAVPAAILIAVYTPGVDAAAIGPLRPAAYLTTYAYIGVPNAFVATALQFALAVRSGRPMASYLGSLILIFIGFFIASLVLFHRRAGTLVDPIGIRFIVEDMSHLWTTIEKRSRLITLEGVILQNRAIWVAVGLGVLAYTYGSFRFAHRSETGRRWLRRRVGPEAHSLAPIAGSHPVSPRLVEVVPRTFGFSIHARQALDIGLSSFRMIATSWAGIATLVFIPLLSVAVVIDQMASAGGPLVPTTIRVIAELTGPLSAELSRWVIIPLLIVFFAGELVWRERETGLSEMTDSAPIPGWVPLAGKFLGLGLILVLLMAGLTLAGTAAQTILGYQQFESALYFKTLFGLQLTEYLLFAPIAVAVHVLVNQKYVGHLAAIVAYVVLAMSSLFGLEHNLLIYGADPGWSYTQMSGFGRSLGPWLWFKLYWAAWAMLVVLLTGLLWVRGRENGLRLRLQLARRSLTGGVAAAVGVALTLIITLGGFIFYNTNVLNAYRSSAGVTRLQAEYEQRYKRYETAAQPELVATRLRVEIHPERGEAEVRGSHHLLNRTDAPIDSIHVSTAPGREPLSHGIDRESTLLVADDERGHRIYRLTAPLQPGDSVELTFHVRIGSAGFTNRGVDPSIVANGSHFTNGSFPAIGYQRSRELIVPADRRDHGLPARPVIPSLYDEDERMRFAGGAALETVLGTDEGQVAVAPGKLLRSWNEGDRSYFQYSSGGPIGGEHSFFSANYAVRQEDWAGTGSGGAPVTIQIFHHPDHTGNLDRLIRATRASLDYYTRHFGPYGRDYLTIVEGPGNGTGMHADGPMISYASGFAFWDEDHDPATFDQPSAIVAHEIAHLWTLPYAFVEGAPVMSESLAWYYGMQVVRESYGAPQLRKLLSFMRQPNAYPPIRRGEPLLRGLDQYMSYRRGPFALYALSQYIGEDQVNSALRTLNAKHSSGAPPLATTLDLHRELAAVTPDSLRYLLHDLFEVNTFWELESTGVSAEAIGAGEWEVTLAVRARKVVADSAGVESEPPMDEPVQIGVFASGEPGDELGNPLYLQMHRIRSGEQSITVRVSGQPLLAGIDPHHLLDWEEAADDDNVAPVAMEGSETS